MMQEVQNITEEELETYEDAYDEDLEDEAWSHDPEDFEDHEDLAEALLEIAYEERRCIRELQIAEMKGWMKQRVALTRHAMELAREEPVSSQAANDYRHVQYLAQENLALLQDAQGAVSEMIRHLLGPRPDTYGSLAGKTEGRAPKGVLVWKG